MKEKKNLGAILGIVGGLGIAVVAGITALLPKKDENTEETTSEEVESEEETTEEESGDVE